MVASNDYVEIVVSVRRVVKVAKGGPNVSISVLLVAGDKRGSIGYGIAKGREISDARVKASRMAKKNMFRVPLKNIEQYTMT
jgi:small subunit ribosomal protein S5